ncbi:MAG: hypothetical protein IT229_08935 [Flavobacteriales bacterium]|nr:hypothetical protein [Flavobacteriales bacterium]
MIAKSGPALIELAVVVLPIRRRDQLRLWPSIAIVSLVLIVPEVIGLLISIMLFTICG